MKGQKNSNWEFHGFASNPQKSFEDGKKGDRLAVQASLDKGRPSAESSSQSSSSSSSKQTPRASQGKGWQNAGSSSRKSSSGKQSKADSEE